MHDEIKLDKEIEDKVVSKLEKIDKFRESLYVDESNIDKAILAVKESENIGQVLSSATGKAQFYEKYAEASNLIKPFVEKAEELKKIIRYKIWLWVRNGGKHKLLSTRNDGYEAEVTDESMVPDEWKCADISRIQKEAKKLDGHLIVPGVIIKPKQTLVIKNKE